MKRPQQPSSMQSTARPRLGVFVTAAFLVASLAGCLDEGGQTGPAEGSGAGADEEGNQTGPPRDPVTWHIEITGSQFVAGTITIQAGDTVEWTTRDIVAHSVTADNDDFDSGLMLTAPMVDTFTFTFDDVGKYPYHCQVHGAMDATITVVERLDGVS